MLLTIKIFYNNNDDKKNENIVIMIKICNETNSDNNKRNEINDDICFKGEVHQFYIGVLFISDHVSSLFLTPFLPKCTQVRDERFY